MIKRIVNSETLTNLLWLIFGLLTGLKYLEEQQYFISGTCFLIGLFSGYKVLKSLFKKNDIEKK